MSDNNDTENEEPIATFEAAFLPDWEWEVFEVQERDADVVVGVDDDGEYEVRVTTIYYGRVKSPMTYGGWDYGTFTVHDLKTAGAFRTDRDTGEWP